MEEVCYRGNVWTHLQAYSVENPEDSNTAKWFVAENGRFFMVKDILCRAISSQCTGTEVYLYIKCLKEVAFWVFSKRRSRSIA